MLLASSASKLAASKSVIRFCSHTATYFRHTCSYTNTCPKFHTTGAAILSKSLRFPHSMWRRGVLSQGENTGRFWPIFFFFPLGVPFVFCRCLALLLFLRTWIRCHVFSPICAVFLFLLLSWLCNLLSCHCRVFALLLLLLCFPLSYHEHRKPSFLPPPPLCNAQDRAFKGK